MQQVITDSHCPICQNTRAIPRFQVPFPRHSALGVHGFSLRQKLEVPAWLIVQCTVCLAGFPHPYPTRAQIDEFYAGQQEPNDYEMEHYVNMREAKRQGWRDFADKLTRLRGGPGRLLEIGCAAGWLLQAARDGGWQVAGIEATPKFQKYASQTLGLPVQRGTIDLLKENRPAEPFDTIVMTDVIEHLQDPVGDLRTLRHSIADDGYMVVATCDIGSLAARFYGHKWRQCVMSHTVYWTHRAMSLAMERAGFAVESFSEVRYWDPDPARERKAKAREVAKLAARAALFNGYVRPAERFEPLRKLPALLTRGRLDHADLKWKIGDQPILGDVMLVVARPINGNTVE